MNKNSLSIGIFAGLLAIAAAIVISVSSALSAKRTVTVRGLCEMEVQADRVIWPIGFVEGGKDLKAMAISVEKKNMAIVEWLVANGIDRNDITISAVNVEDHRASGYTSGYDYVMKAAVTVCTSQVEKAIELQGSQFELLSKGIAVGGYSWEYPVVYEYTRLNEIKPEMIEKATINAREAADKFAKDSRSKVGKIVTANQGQFSINDRDAKTPYIKTVRVVTTITYQLN